MSYEITQSLGLSPAQARLLRALFQHHDAAGRGAAERRSWLVGQLRKGDEARVLSGLFRAGLISQNYQLTWVGLVVAANLPALGSSLSGELAA